MSEQSAKEFVLAAAKSAALTEESRILTADKSPADAAIAISALGKREGFDFTADEMAEVRRGFLASHELSEEDLTKVAGGGNQGDVWSTMQPGLGMGLGSIFGQFFPGAGGLLGTTVAAGITTAAQGGSAEESIIAGANAFEQAKNDIVAFFSAW